MTWKYYAKKILYYLRQQKILNNLKAFLQQPDDYESYLEGGSVCAADGVFGGWAAFKSLRQLFPPEREEKKAFQWASKEADDTQT